MENRQVQSQEPVTLIGGADPSAESLEEALKFAPFLVAADGGADFALVQGSVPDAVIGDLDSLSDAARGRIEASKIIEIAEQDSTDFEKCMRSIQAPLVIGVGFLSGRLDHTLAVLSTLAQSIGPRTILIGEEDIVFAVPDRLSIDLPLGARLSLFPMANVQGRSVGLRWAINGLVFSPNGRVGTSNEVVGPVDLAFDRPGMLVITPRAALLSVLAAVRG